MKFLRYLTTDIWRDTLYDASPLRRVGVGLLQKLLLTIRFFTARRVIREAAALTYSTLLALVPIFAVVFAIARGFGYNKYIEAWFLDTFQSQPEAAKVIVGFVNSYLVHTKSGIFLGVGLIFMLYTVLMLVSNIEQTFNGIWQVKRQRSVYRTVTDYFAMLLAVPLVIVITSGVSLYIAAVAGSVETPLLGHTVRFLVSLTPYAVMSLVFTGIYVFVPNCHVRLRSAIVPGILAGVAMQWLQALYVHSQIWVTGYNAIYGSFAALPMFMLWVQISWTICLFGAVLCYTGQNMDSCLFDTQASDISHLCRLLLSAAVMGRVCRAFESGGRAMDVAGLSAALRVPKHIVADLVYTLASSGLLLETGRDEKDAPALYVPAGSPDRLTLGTLISRLEARGQWTANISPRDLLRPQTAALLLRLRREYIRKAGEVLLREL